MKVSIIIPAYNTARFLTEAVQSALDQEDTAKNDLEIEVIVVDDGSTDETPELMRPWVEREPRIRYIRQANAGVSVALNTGIAHASGDYLTFLGSDDVLFPHKTRVQLAAMQAHPHLGLVASGYVLVDPEGRPLYELRLWQDFPNLDDVRVWLQGCPVITNGVLVRRDWVQRANGFDPELRHAEDKDLWLRLAWLGCKMMWVPDIVCAYRTHPQQLTRKGHEQKNGTLASLQKFFAQPNLPEDIVNERETILASAYLEGAFREYGAGQVDLARRSLGEALKRDATLLKPNPHPGELPPILYTLISWATLPNAGSAAAYLANFFNHLAPEAASLAMYRSQALVAAAVCAAANACHVGHVGQATQQLTAALHQDASMAERGDWACRKLIDFVRCLPQESQTACIKRFFQVLPDGLQHWRSKQRVTLGQLHIEHGFIAHQHGQQRLAAREVWQAIKLSPAWIGNRGVQSILLKSFMVRPRA